MAVPWACSSFQACLYRRESSEFRVAVWQLVEMDVAGFWRSAWTSRKGVATVVPGSAWTAAGREMYFPPVSLQTIQTSQDYLIKSLWHWFSAVTACESCRGVPLYHQRHTQGEGQCQELTFPSGVWMKDCCSLKWMQRQSTKNIADMSLLSAPLPDTFCPQFLPTLLQALQCHQVEYYSFLFVWIKALDLGIRL